jgi:hypothetical protein
MDLQGPFGPPERARRIVPVDRCISRAQVLTMVNTAIANQRVAFGKTAHSRFATETSIDMNNADVSEAVANMMLLMHLTTLEPKQICAHAVTLAKLHTKQQERTTKPKPGGELKSWNLKEDLPWERVESALRSDLATLPPRPVCMQGRHVMGLFVEHEKKIRPRSSELNDFRVDKWFQSGGKKGSTLMPAYGVPHIRRRYGRVLRIDGRQHKMAVYELVGADDPKLAQRRLYHVMPVVPKRQYAARDTTADPEVKNKKRPRDAKRAKLAKRAKRAKLRTA